MFNWDQLSNTQKVEAIVSDLVSDFLYYDRKECEDFRPGEIDEMVKNGEITVDRIVEVFRKELIEGLK